MKQYLRPHGAKFIDFKTFQGRILNQKTLNAFTYFHILVLGMFDKLFKDNALFG